MRNVLVTSAICVQYSSPAFCVDPDLTVCELRADGERFHFVWLVKQAGLLYKGMLNVKC